MVSKQKVVVSGMRPTGELHLGHLHGVIENWVKIQQDADFQCYFFVADYHRLTTKSEEVENIRQISENIVLDWLAFGLDPEKATIFVQSDVPEHAELHLFLSMLTPVGWLERVPSYKDFVASLSSQDSAPYGFLGYAVLQTADVAIYNGSHVPIGQDQAAHLEISREIVRRFNHMYKTDCLVEPQPLFTEIPCLLGTDGRKMSKSYDNGIWLSDEGKGLEKKIMGFVTDPARIKRTDPGDPEKCPVFDFHKIHTSESDRAEIVEGCTTGTMGCVDCKRKLAGNLQAFMEPYQARRKELETRRGDVKEILQAGAEKARIRAKEKLAQVKEVMGL